MEKEGGDGAGVFGQRRLFPGRSVAPRSGQGGGGGICVSFHRLHRLPASFDPSIIASGRRPTIPSEDDASGKSLADPGRCPGIAALLEWAGPAAFVDSTTPRRQGPHPAIYTDGSGALRAASAGIGPGFFRRYHPPEGSTPCFRRAAGAAGFTDVLLSRHRCGDKLSLASCKTDQCITELGQANRLAPPHPWISFSFFVDVVVGELRPCTGGVMAFANRRGIIAGKRRGNL